MKIQIVEGRGERGKESVCALLNNTFEEKRCSACTEERHTPNMPRDITNLK
jgi:hypothetical protein